MKQKIVIKICGNDQKSRRKALETAVHISGVESVSFKDSTIEVTGEGVDAVELTKLMRQRFGTRYRCLIKRKGYAEIVSIGPVPPKKEEPKPPPKKDVTSGCQCGCGMPHPCRPTFVCVDQLPYDSCHSLSFCSIM